MKRAHLLALAALMPLFACGPSAEPLTPPPPLAPWITASAAPARSAAAPADPMAIAPASEPEGPFVAPTIEEHRLGNGIRVLLVERHELPVVALRLAFDRGVDQGPPGVGSFTAAMLFQGTKTRSALQLDDELRDLGIEAEPSAEYDAIAVDAHCLRNTLPRALEIVADVVQHPAFAADEVERMRSRRLTSWLQQSDRPDPLLVSTTMALLYPAGHPYHLPVIGDEASLTAVTVADLRSFQQANLVPERLTLAVAGDVTMSAILPELTRVFGRWKGSAPAPTVAATPALTSTPRVTLVDRPGLTQAWVSVAAVSVSRATPDFDAITMMNTILGGYHASRLNLSLREKHAYTYGAQSSFAFGRGPGPFTAGATVGREQVGAALAEIFKELSRMREERVSQEELDDARSRAIRKMPARFETAISTAATVAMVSVLGLPLDEFRARPDRFRKVTIDDVQRVAAKVLSPEALRVIVVGDAKVVKAQLDALGLGEVVVKSAPRAAAKSNAGSGKAAPGKPGGKK